MSKRKTIALWTISGLLAAVFLFSGGIKLAEPVKNQATFGQFGYAGWFETFIGVCEMLGGCMSQHPHGGGGIYPGRT